MDVVDLTDDIDVNSHVKPEENDTDNASLFADEYDFNDTETRQTPTNHSVRENQVDETKSDEMKKRIEEIDDEIVQISSQLEEVRNQLDMLKAQQSSLLERKTALLDKKMHLMDVVVARMEGRAVNLNSIPPDIPKPVLFSSKPKSMVSDAPATFAARPVPIGATKKPMQIQQATLEQVSNPKHNVENWRKKFPWSEEMEKYAKNFFGISSFRTNQQEVMNATMSNEHCFVIMPTGAGKSLCYQLPSLLTVHKITLVVSPLISLMEDQVMQLQNVGIDAVMFTATTSKEETKRIFSELLNSKSSLKLLYVTPEKAVKSKRLLSTLEKVYAAGRLDRIVVDEAHCCSQWGHDFRPDYLRVGGVLREQFKKTPVIALTATATTRVIDDVRNILRIRDCIIFKSGFNRPNLWYEVRKKSATSSEVVSDIANFIKENYPRESGIVYCFSKKESEDIAKELKELGIKAECYHSNVDDYQRTSVHHAWSNGDLQVIVATVAFGMGINKPDVRFVIHHSISKSIESYYQESGRAGRDGLKAHCILYYRPSDATRQSSLFFGGMDPKDKSYRDTDSPYRQPLVSIRNMIKFAQNLKECRRVMISKYFGESFTRDQCDASCDNCHDKNEVDTKDITAWAKTLIEIVRDMKDERITLLQLSDVWRGIGKKKASIEFENAPSYIKKEECERIIAHLLCEDILDEQFYHTSYSVNTFLVVGACAKDVSSGKMKVMMDFLKTEKKRTTVRAKTTADKENLRHQLIKLRIEIAKTQNVFPHIILPEPKLDAILIKKPKDMAALEDILGSQMASKYGEQILKVILENSTGEFSSQGTPASTPNKSKSSKKEEVPAKNSGNKGKQAETKKRKQESPDLRDADEVPTFETGLAMDVASGSEGEQDEDLQFLSTLHNSCSNVSRSNAKTSPKGIFDSPSQNSDDSLLGYDLDDIMTPTKKKTKT